MYVVGHLEWRIHYVADVASRSHLHALLVWQRSEAIYFSRSYFVEHWMLNAPSGQLIHDLLWKLCINRLWRPWIFLKSALSGSNCRNCWKRQKDNRWFIVWQTVNIKSLLWDHHSWLSWAEYIHIFKWISLVYKKPKW